MNRIYTDRFLAEARLEDGRTLTTTGTLMECAYWADNILRAEEFKEIDITVIRKDKDHETDKK